MLKIAEMNTTELHYTLALQHASNIGDINAKKLIAHCGSAENIFKEKKSNLQKINGIGSLITKNLFDAENLIEAEKELNYILKHNIKHSYFKDNDFPERLKHCVDGPILFFYEGNIDFSNLRCISIVGTRKLTSYGRSICNELVADLKPFNPIIVSGFAYGTDICAHKAAVKNELQTIAIMANGLNKTYPQAHIKYKKDILLNGGFVSEFWHNEQPLRENFLKRNRIIAGLSEATIIIESAEKGGSLVTADIANSYSRDVFAVPGRVTDTYSKGNNNLIKNNNAAILTSSDDLVKMLNWELKSEKSKPIQKQLFVELTEEEQPIVDFLQKEGKQLLDIISLNCKIPIQSTASILFNLEMKGVVKPLPGKLFEVV